MRFVSKYPNLGLGTVIKEKFVLALDGQRDQVQESVYVVFNQIGLLEPDIEAALAHWPEKGFQGRWLDEDQISLQPVGERIGVFDSEEQGWDENIRVMVEKWMLAKPNFGIDFIRVEAPIPSAPWPSYDRMHHNKIPMFAAESGLVDEALAYERATKNRDTVIKKLEETLGAEVIAGETDQGELVVA